MLSAWLLALVASSAPVDVATYAYPAYDRRAALAPLAAALSDKLARPVNITVYPTPASLVAAAQAGKVDLAAPNLAAYLQMRASLEVQPVAMIDTPAATQDRYRGVLVARRAVGLRRASDLRRARLSVLRYTEVVPGSTSGGLVQAALLAALDIDPADFRERRHAGTHEAALAELVEGRSDLAALAETPWLELLKREPARAKALAPIWRSPPIPAGPLVCIPSADVACDELGAALLEPTPAMLEAAAALSSAWSETSGGRRFIPVDIRIYAPFEPGAP